MKLLLVHPSCLMYSQVYLRLEPLGLELVAAAAARAGHEVRILDLQVSRHADYFRHLRTWRPDAVGYSLNYLANIPEVIDLARATRRLNPRCFLFAGGHSASFTAPELLEHAGGALDCVVRGEGEEVTPRLLAMAERGGTRFEELPGVATARGSGPAPQLIHDLDALRPARRLLPKRGRYFIGILDPCASIEFTRGCPWDCSFCSAWTFYGRSYRQRDPEAVGDELARVREPGVFILDDVAFIHPEHGEAIGRQLERRRIRKSFYLETRSDVLLRNKEVFRFWRKLGLEYMFLGLEAMDDDGLKAHRKRITAGKNAEALEFARSLGLAVAVNLIADPAWDRQKFTAVREWAASLPEIVHLTVNTPYPGTETWLTESRRLTTLDYRLFDVQHAVLPTALPLPEFYGELVKTQQVLYRKHLGWAGLAGTLRVHGANLLRGRTNFLRMLWRFNSVYNAAAQVRDHERPVDYALTPPARHAETVKDRTELYVLQPAPAPAPNLERRAS